MEVEVVRLLAESATRSRAGPGVRTPIPGPPPRPPPRRHRGRGGRRSRGDRLAGRPSPRAPPGRRRHQRVRRRQPGGRRSPPVPDPGRREGLRGLPAHVPRNVGSWLHAASRTTRRSSPPRRSRASRCPARPRVTPVMRTFFESAAETLGGEAATLLRAMARRGPRPGRGGHRPAVRARVRPGRAGAPPGHDLSERHPCRREVQRHPRRGDARARLPVPAGDGRAGDAGRGRRAAGARSWRQPARSSSSRPHRRSSRPPIPSSTGSSSGPIVDHDPEGVPLPVMAPFATDNKHLARIGVPAYGFSPLRLAPDEAYLERYHGVDERVSLEALRWGLPVLYDAVRRFCG